MTQPTKQAKTNSAWIPFHAAAVGEEEVSAVADAMRSGWLTMGPRTMEFENNFAEYVGAKHAVAVSSCTAALHLAYDAIGLKAEDEMLVPSITFAATAEAVIYFGARPVIVDVDPLTLNISVQDLVRKITPRTKAIVPVHYAGQPCDMEEIRELAARHNLRVIEDAAHAVPASYRGTRVGAISEITCFSFYATKTLATGEGGMVTTDDEEIANRVRLMRSHGIGRDAWKRYSAAGSWYYEIVDAGYKYNMTDLQAAMGLVQLGKCDAMRRQRAAISSRYDKAFGVMPFFEVPTLKNDRESAFHLYPLRLNLETLTIDRAKFIEELKDRGIGTSVHFIPLHMHPYYCRNYGYAPHDLPISAHEYERYFSLPFFPTMTEEQISHVIENVIDVAKAHQR